MELNLSLDIFYFTFTFFLSMPMNCLELEPKQGFRTKNISGTSTTY